MTDPLLDRLGPVPAPPSLLGDVLAAVGLVPDRYVVRPSPIGAVLVAYNDSGVSACVVVAGRPEDEVAEAASSRSGRPCVADPDPDADLVQRIDTALAGHPPDGLTYDLRGASAFQRAVLDKTAEIPAGEVRPYGWVAAEIGRPGAVRAVGTALGRNPVPLLIPCHRVVRTDGRVGDYAFGSAAKSVALRAEGLDLDDLERLAAGGIRFIGVDAAGTFCHPTCGAVRDVPADERVALRSTGAALARGLRPCPRCRPAAGAAA